MGRGIVGLLALGAALAAASYARPAAGQCAACACGDPTLTSMGAEQPFAGRLRASLDVAYRSDRIGDPSADEARIDEVRAAPALSWAPAREWSLAATLPIVLRDVAYPNGAHDRALAPGDLDLRARWFVLRDRDLGPSHLLAVGLSLALPTAPSLTDDHGRTLDERAQVGSATVVAGASASYSWFARPWHAYASAAVAVPTYERDGMRMGVAGNFTAVVQRHFGPAIAARLGADARVEAPSTMQGQPERDSGGFVLYATTGLLASFATDFVLDIRVSIPTLQLLRGFHREGVTVGLGAVYDL